MTDGVLFVSMFLKVGVVICFVATVLMTIYISTTHYPKIFVRHRRNDLLVLGGIVLLFILFGIAGRKLGAS